MRIVNSTEIVDTFAEAFPMTAVRVIVTAATAEWAKIAADTTTGYACSVIGCDAEAGLERELSPAETPDGRPGVRLLFFGFSREALQKAVINRIGQCVLTCPTTAVYNDLPIIPEKSLRIGGNLRYFGDGWQISKLHGQRRFWRMPTMDGEFLCEDLFGTTKGVAGGNLLLMGRTQAHTLQVAQQVVVACRSVPGVILPFPGGIVRSGSKVGSKYPKLRASTNEAYCPTLRGVVPTELPDGVNAVYEVVLDGLDEASVTLAMKRGLEVACQPGIVRVSAGNYGGKLGPFHLRLYPLLDAAGG